MAGKTTVHSLRCEKMLAGDVRVDRASEWGNPFIVGKDGTRDEVVAKHRAMIERSLWLGRVVGDVSFADRLAKLHGRRLFCWCAPLPCHADTLAEYAALCAAE